MTRRQSGRDAAAPAMRSYASPDSGVRAYASLAAAIHVQFADGTVYEYTHAVTGRDRVEAMKRLARAGRGLATYISQHVGAGYAAKRAPEAAPGSSSRRPDWPGS